MRTTPDWVRCEPAYVDADLERVLEAVGDGQLTARIAAVLATSMARRPHAAMRAWRVLVARMDGQTLDQIAAVEGRSREGIRQILRQIRKIVATQPHLFDGYGGLNHAAQCEVRDCRFESRYWRRGYTTEPPKTANLRETAITVPARKAID